MANNAQSCDPELPLLCVVHGVRILTSSLSTTRSCIMSLKLNTRALLVLGATARWVLCSGATSGAWDQQCVGLPLDRTPKTPIFRKTFSSTPFPCLLQSHARTNRTSSTPLPMQLTPILRRKHKHFVRCIRTACTRKRSGLCVPPVLLEPISAPFASIALPKRFQKSADPSFACR